MSKPVISGLALLPVLFTMLAPCSTYAQGPTSADPKSGQKQASATEVKGAKDSASKKITLDNPFLVEDKREKPSAFYILRRSSVNYDWARLDVRLTPLVLESVQDPLF